MTLDCPSAMTPFLTASISVLASGASRSDAVDAVPVRAASVRAGDPQAGGNSQGERWVVSFREADWVSPRRPSEGCAIEADKISGRWPRLTVRRVQFLAGMCVLECSARERGGRP